MGIKLPEHVVSRWSGSIRTLEAQKDGVLFRPLSETLSVDECVVVRPELTSSQIASGIQRVCLHEGKGYNSDFDFFRSDQLVCTEVIYRAFDGLGKVNFKLIERAGRFSLTAEDILDMAVNQNGFNAIAAFGFKGCEHKIVNDNDALEVISVSYKSNQKSCYLKNSAEFKVLGNKI